MTLAMVGFTLTDMFIKLASVSLPTGQITLILGLGGFTMFAAFCRYKRIAILSQMFFYPTVILRNMLEILSTASIVLSLALLEFSTVSAILQASPLLMTLGAALILGENVRWRRWTAIMLGFVGVLMIVRPGLDGFELNSLLALCAVIAISGRDLVTRAIPSDVPTTLLSTYALLTLVPTGVVMLALSGEAMILPNARVSAYLVAMILSGFLGYFAITAAMRTGEVSAIAPFRYSRILFALLIGFFLFGERPDQMTLMGSALIVLSGLYAMGRAKGSKSTAKTGGTEPGDAAPYC